MKPPRFEYFDPATVEDALALLAERGDDVKVLAGGQSLVPLLNFRLARPGALVDLNGIASLAYVRPWDSGLAIGAMTRQRAVERSPLVGERCPLLAEALPLVGHVPIRNRGTVGGSLAHADPAAELPAVISALGAELLVRGPGGERVVRADDFFVAYLTTALEPSELLIEVRLPAMPARTGHAFLEVSRRHGDFALVGVAALVTLDAGGVCTQAALALIGVGPAPVRAERAARALVGTRVEARATEEAARLVRETLDPGSDIHASADYRRHVGGVLAQRALVRAVARARGERDPGDGSPGAGVPGAGVPGASSPGGGGREGR